VDAARDPRERPRGERLDRRSPLRCRGWVRGGGVQGPLAGFRIAEAETASVACLTAAPAGSAVPPRSRRPAPATERSSETSSLRRGATDLLASRAGMLGKARVKTR